MGRPTSLPNSSSRIRLTMLWLSLALHSPCRSWLPPYTPYTASITSSVTASRPSRAPAMMSMARLWRLGAQMPQTVPTATMASRPSSNSFSLAK